MLKSDDWQDLWNTWQPYWLLLSLHVTTLLSVWDKATFYIPPEASLNCVANAGCQTSWNEFRRQASTPPGCFNHSSRHSLLSPRASSSLVFENQDDITWMLLPLLFEEGGKSTVAMLGALARISCWPSTAVLIQPWRNGSSRRDGIGELTLNMDRGRMGQTGKVTGSPWKCVCMCACVCDCCEWSKARKS